LTHRRGNGLPADSFAPLAPLPRSRADTLLEALRDAGIAAYAAPLETDEDHLGGGALLESPPAAPEESTDRVYVDASAHTRAIEVLRSLPADDPDGLPSGTTATSPPDAQWEDLVARFYDSGQADSALWPDAENVEEPRRTPESSSDTPAAGADLLDEPGAWRPAREEDADDEGHYIPPPPPPIPTGTLATRLAWAGVLGGPTLAVVMVVLLGRTLPPWLGFCIVAGFIAGFVVLVLRMEDRPPRSSDPDDGAVT
jgi:hypothetical protein